MDVNFVKWFFYIYRGDRVIFILCFVGVVNHIDWFADVELSLYPWDKSHLVVVYDPLMCCLIWLANILLGILLLFNIFI